LKDESPSPTRRERERKKGGGGTCQNLGPLTTTKGQVAGSRQVTWGRNKNRGGGLGRTASKTSTRETKKTRRARWSGGQLNGNFKMIRGLNPNLKGGGKRKVKGQHKKTRD